MNATQAATQATIRPPLADLYTRTCIDRLLTRIDEVQWSHDPAWSGARARHWAGEAAASIQARIRHRPSRQDTLYFVSDCAILEHPMTISRAVEMILAACQQERKSA